MADLHFTAVYENGNDIKTAAIVSEVMEAQVGKSRPADLPLLLRGNRFGRITKTDAAPGFNLNKDQGIMFAGDDIDFPGVAPEIPGEDPVAFFHQISDGRFFTGPSQINPFMRQTLLPP